MTETTNNIKFRKSFSKLLNPCNCSAIEYAFQKFCFEYDAYAAGSLLWALTCSNSSSESSLNCLDLDYSIISRKNIKLLRNELRFQYKKFHPDFFCATTFRCLPESFC